MIQADTGTVCQAEVGDWQIEEGSQVCDRRAAQVEIFHPGIAKPVEICNSRSRQIKFLDWQARQWEDLTDLVAVEFQREIIPRRLELSPSELGIKEAECIPDELQMCAVQFAGPIYPLK